MHDGTLLGVEHVRVGDWVANPNTQAVSRVVQTRSTNTNEHGVYPLARYMGMRADARQMVFANGMWTSIGTLSAPVKEACCRIHALVLEPYKDLTVDGVVCAAHNVCEVREETRSTMTRAANGTFARRGSFFVWHHQ